MDSYSDRLEAFRQHDAARDALVAEVIQKYDKLRIEHERKCDDYENEVESRLLWQQKARSHEQALKAHKQASDSNSFVLVILDGDGAVFTDELYAMGKEGGAEAAHRLHSEIKESLRASYPDQAVDDWNVVVQVVLNLQGLANKLQACDIVSNPNQITAFGRAFGLAQPLFSFIDVGEGKERADHKIRETLRVFLPNAQCKHVFFGPCNDNGYVVVLERYKRDYASRLTLVETRRPETGFIALGFPRITWPSVFRGNNLPDRPNGGAQLPYRSTSIPMHPTTAAVIPSSTSPAPSLETTISNSWATVGKSSATNGKTINIAPKKSARRFILLNASGERLDSDLPRSDSKAEARLKERRNAANKNFCNNYHLIGKCEQAEYCDYQHGERLTGGELLALKHRARNLLCYSEYCQDFDCYLGHHCKSGKMCTIRECWFEDTHYMDLTPFKKIYEDGSEEVA